MIRAEADAEDGRLDGRKVDLWWMVPAAHVDPASVGDYWDLLGGEEIERQRRFRQGIDRQNHLISRILLRRTLSRYAEIPPSAWRFRRKGQGRPELEPGLCDTDLRFNLSHTRGLIAVAVTIGRDIGVDVEDRSRRRGWSAIAGRFFPPEEGDRLHRLPAGEGHDRFLESWVLKEAYIKARGLAVPGPLSLISFPAEPGRPIEARFDTRLGDDPAAWQFALFRPTTVHLMALAVRRGRGPDLPIRVRRTGF